MNKAIKNEIMNQIQNARVKLERALANGNNVDPISGHTVQDIQYWLEEIIVADATPLQVKAAARAVLQKVSVNLNVYK